MLRSRAERALTSLVTPSFTPSIGGILPMFLVLAFMYSVSAIIKGLVLEKELQLKEVLRAVGVRSGTLWCSQFIENVVLLAVPCALISVMVKVSGDSVRWLAIGGRHITKCYGLGVLGGS
ncbi:hypothetical protein Z043_119198 [Scleropages formosus]|uniref:Uncharacterized protein n=1 Tax=Scleropages formosus TaxID=113540 RepID=A0A0P7TNC1_SCLFO|nr:hypothetical protein Z043_119198 [Scleropages formosus]